MNSLWHREKEDEEAARQLAEELEKEEALKRQVTAIRDEQLARRMQVRSTSFSLNTRRVMTMI